MSQQLKIENKGLRAIVQLSNTPNEIRAILFGMNGGVEVVVNGEVITVKPNRQVIGKAVGTVSVGQGGCSLEAAQRVPPGEPYMLVTVFKKIEILSSDPTMVCIQAPPPF